MLGSQNEATYKTSTTWYLEKATLKIKLPKNLDKQYSTSGNSLAFSIKTTLIN